MPEHNAVMMQAFHWYSPDDGTFWDQLAARAGEFAAAGIDAVWLPPASKGANGTADVGYGVYDLYDLGEFDQKGTVRTKYGTKTQYLAVVKAIQAAGVRVYADIVLNHRLGADAFEPVRATPFPADDRRTPKGEPREVRAATSFTFPGRAGAHSAFAWNWTHFDGSDYDHNQPDDRSTVYLFDGKQWDDRVSLEFGSFAFLMGADLDFESPEVNDELTRWGRWFLDTTGVDGFRFDAVKHISAPVFPAWLEHMRAHAGKDLFTVAEYWSGNVGELHGFLDEAGPLFTAFDVPLHYNFHAASRAGGNYDMRRLFDGSLVKDRPLQAVTFVTNHDSQPLQALESVVEPWFVPLAYACILLRRDGYPCLFLPDLDGAAYEDVGRDGNRHRVVMPSHRVLLDVFLRARKGYGHGEQVDYFDHWNRIGWVRLGTAEHPKAMAVLLSDGPAGTKWMGTNRPEGTTFRDLTGHVADAVAVNADGFGEFRCDGGSVSVWVEE
ncbi:alpha-amylase [Urbifossiella limnaea]|uniref:Alpha-amylase n=1 Tax=Urbifossiella limnaea TaxID=2528023 RepID=A0A517XWK2_9BACT|nr:alpha-amylase [Urbifossiella limnaea]QDU21854.1 Alpha-amylase precursor [Urbifossiella limnaea]